MKKLMTIFLLSFGFSLTLSTVAQALPYGNIETTTLFIGDFGEPRGLSGTNKTFGEVEAGYPLAVLAPGATSLSMDFETVRSYFKNSGQRAVLLSTADLNSTLRNLDAEILETDFDILVVPSLSTLNAIDFSAGIAQIAKRVDRDRAFFLFDLPVGVKPNLEGTKLQAIKDSKMIRVASFSPALRLPDGKLIPNGGAIAGIMSRVDFGIGPWKSASGTAIKFAAGDVLDSEPTPNECTNWFSVTPIGVNCLRTNRSRVIPWGARLAKIGDPSERYISVRRAIDYFEKATAKHLEWARTAPMTEATFQTIREQLGWDLYSFWQSKALVGAQQSEAFYVRCGLGQTMTALDISEGRLIVEFGTALLRPSEFNLSRLVIQQRRTPSPTP